MPLPPLNAGVLDCVLLCANDAHDRAAALADWVRTREPGPLDTDEIEYLLDIQVALDSAVNAIQTMIIEDHQRLLQVVVPHATHH